MTEKVDDRVKIKCPVCQGEGFVYEGSYYDADVESYCCERCEGEGHLHQLHPLRVATLIAVLRDDFGAHFSTSCDPIVDVSEALAWLRQGEDGANYDVDDTLAYLQVLAAGWSRCT